MGLGSFADVTLAEAREKAADLHRKVKAGIDPLAEREARAFAEKVASHQATVRAITFADVANRYITAHEAGWRNRKHRQQWRNTLDTYAMPILGPLPVSDVDTGTVMRVLSPSGGKDRNRVPASWQDKSVLDYATAREWRAGENPARWRGHLDNLLPAPGKVAKVEHHAALPWREIGGFMATLVEQEGVAALALRFAILTAARTGEAIGATWREIDMARAVWTVPAGRMKASREHRVPLSGPGPGSAAGGGATALQFLTRMPPCSPGKPGKPLSNMAMLALLRRMGRGDLTAHGFRSHIPGLVRGNHRSSTRGG